MGRSDILSSFGNRLRELRLAKGITRSRFCRATGIDIETLRKYEAGKLEPTLETIIVMARGLGVSNFELLDIDVDDHDLR